MDDDSGNNNAFDPYQNRKKWILEQIKLKKVQLAKGLEEAAAYLETHGDSLRANASRDLAKYGLIEQKHMYIKIEE